MTILSFTIFANAPVPKIWQYIKNFENVAQWDPSTKSITPISPPTSNMIGSKYRLVSIFKGNETSLQYTLTEYVPEHKIVVVGQNGTTHVIDEMEIRQKGSGTQIIYTANITLRHVLWLLTPFVVGDLEKMASEAEKGMRMKIKQLYG